MPVLRLGSYCALAKRTYSTKPKSKWKSVVGLEVHAQIQSRSKLFSGAANEFASPVNSNVSPFDCSIPGTLPVLNRRCVEAGVLTALALNCRVNPVSTFDRKHYFYADLPAGYQITQQRSPIANDGHLEFQVYAPGVHKAPYAVRTRIKQLQLEQDSGKSVHDVDRSLVDLNRAGAPLMEVVFEPDLSDGEEAAALVKELSLILQRIGSCSCRMEEGALRVDANVSVHRDGEPYGIRTEVKNIGSIRGVAGAVKYEIERQIELLEQGESVVNETRAWDASNKVTLPMRDKEQQQDYRYMPEPNLPPLHVALGPIDKGVVSVDALLKTLPEMPEQTRKRLVGDSGVTIQQAIILVNEPSLLATFEEAVKLHKVGSKLVANLLINDLLTLLHKDKLDLEDVNLNGDHVGQIAALVEDGTINRAVSKLLLDEMVHGNHERPIKIVEKKGWGQINDDDEIAEVCRKTLEGNPEMVAQYRKGKTKVFKALVGIVAGSSSNINMAKATSTMKRLLDES